MEKDTAHQETTAEQLINGSNSGFDEGDADMQISNICANIAQGRKR